MRPHCAGGGNGGDRSPAKAQEKAGGNSEQRPICTGIIIVVV